MNIDIILNIAKQNQEKALEIINNTNIIPIWESTGAEINLIGSLKTGLLMTHRDIDFHIYSDPLKISSSFKAISRLAENPAIVKIEYVNLLQTEENCIEWHTWYQNTPNEIWQIDMIHMPKKSKYAGHFERVTERINTVITTEQRNTILCLKYNTPESENIKGIEYYIAVITDGIRNYKDFERWRKSFKPEYGMDWMP